MGKFFFFSTTPHICAQNDQRDEEIMLRYVCWGTRDPPTPPPTWRPPPPPPRPTALTGPKKFRWGLGSGFESERPL